MSFSARHFAWIGSVLIIAGILGFAADARESRPLAELGVDMSLVWGGDSCWEEAEWGAVCNFNQGMCGDYECQSPTVCGISVKRLSSEEPFYTECLEIVDRNSGHEYCPRFSYLCGLYTWCESGCIGPVGGQYFCYTSYPTDYDEDAVHEVGFECSGS